MTQDSAELKLWAVGAAGRREDASDREFLEAMYDHFSRPLYRYARAILGSDDDAEDAISAVFARLARDMSGARRADDLRAYLFRSARHAAYDILRGRRRRVELELAAVDNCEAASSTDPETDSLRAQLLTLPMEQREVVVLKVFEQMTFGEIAELLGKSANTVASRYRYAMDKLRRELADQGQING